MFAYCSRIIISITVKHEQHIGVMKAFRLPGGLVNSLRPGRQKRFLGWGYQYPG